MDRVVFGNREWRDGMLSPTERTVMSWYLHSPSVAFASNVVHFCSRDFTEEVSDGRG